MEAPVVVAPLPGGARLVLPLPEGATEQTEATLPRVEVGGLPGARVVLRRGWSAEDGLRLRAACVAAPSDRWAPGLEELALGMAHGVARGAVASEVALERWDAAAIRAQNGHFEQDLEGLGSRQGEKVTLHGRHVLGFVGEAKEALLCTLVCEAKDVRARCAAQIDGGLVEALVEPPTPGLLVRGILMAAERPHEAGAVGMAFCLAVVAFVLARRPRPRP